MHIVNTLGPIFIIIALGALLTGVGYITATSRAVMNSICYWVGLPALLVLKIGMADAVGDAARLTLAIVLSGTAALMAAGWLAGRVMKLEPRALATLVHISFRGNLAYIGLPVVCFAFADSPYADKAAPVAAITLGVTVVVYNFVAVFIHLLSTHTLNAAALKRLLLKLLTNPLLLGCAGGFAWNYGAHLNGIAFPVAIERTLSVLGGSALPLALLCIGSALVVTPLREIAGSAVAAALIKTGLGPLLAFGLARLLHAGELESGIAAIMLGAPTAVASFVLTEQLDGKPSLAAAVIVLSTIFCTVGYAVIIAVIS